MSTDRQRARDSIALDYGDLGDGETKAGEVCPSCSGGASKEGSVSITRRGGLLLFNCHRATCSFHGVIDLVGGGGSRAPGTKVRPSYPSCKTYEPTQALVKLLAAKYHIGTEVLGIAGLRWSGDIDGYLGRRVCFPIYGPDGKERGTSYRSYEDGVKPKAIIELRSDDAIASCWYKMKRVSDTLILVEDQMSALKLAPHVHSLALLGTHLSEAKAAEIVAGGYKKVLISLDNDATREAIKMQLAHRNTIKHLYVAGLGTDIKDMTQGELNDYLSQNL